MDQAVRSLAPAFSKEHITIAHCYKTNYYMYTHDSRSFCNAIIFYRATIRVTFFPPPNHVHSVHEIICLSRKHPSSTLVIHRVDHLPSLFFHENQASLFSFRTREERVSV